MLCMHQNKKNNFLDKIKIYVPIGQTFLIPLTFSSMKQSKVLQSLCRPVANIPSGGRHNKGKPLIVPKTRERRELNLFLTLNVHELSL